MLLLGRGIDSLHLCVFVIFCSRPIDAIVIFFPQLVVLPCTILFRPSFLLLVEQVSLYEFLLFFW